MIPRRNGYSRRSGGLQMYGVYVIGALLGGSALVSCSGEEETRALVDTTHSSVPTVSGTPEHLGPATYPVNGKSSHFSERLIYPVREGVPDPLQNWVDVYLPGAYDAGETVPLIVFVHGGAWHKGADGADPLANDLASRGAAVLNLEYRDISQGGGWPQTFTDVADALDVIPDLLNRYPQMDAEQVSVVGHSAGAQLAVWAATRGGQGGHRLGENPKFIPSSVVSLAGPLDLVWAADNGDENIVRAIGGKPKELSEQYASVDPIQNLNTLVPVTAVHGAEDGLVPPDNSRHYVEALKKQKGTAELVILEGENHISFLKTESPNREKVMEIILDGAGIALRPR